MLVVLGGGVVAVGVVVVIGPIGVAIGEMCVVIGEIGVAIGEIGASTLSQKASRRSVGIEDLGPHSVQRTAPSRSAKVQCGGRRRFIDWVLAYRRDSVDRGRMGLRARHPEQT